MSNFFYPKDKRIPIKQVHPRVLVTERQCCDCVNIDRTKQADPFYLYCLVHKKEVNRYDECSAFDLKKVGE